MSVITLSGQVALHSPHWTQAASEKRRTGRSGSSDNAPVGQTDTQARHNVQPSATSTAPNGAPDGSAIISVVAEPARWSSPNARRSRLGRVPIGTKPAGRATG